MACRRSPLESGTEFLRLPAVAAKWQKKTSGKQNPEFMRQSINMHARIERAQQRNKGDKTKSDGLDLKTKANKRMKQIREGSDSAGISAE